jgi:hypothetical protein
MHVTLVHARLRILVSIRVIASKSKFAAKRENLACPGLASHLSKQTGLRKKRLT